MRKLLWVCLSVYLFCLTQTVLAVRLNSLYQAKVPVTSQSAAERNRMLAPGLQQVLIKVSGNPHVLDNPKVKTQLSAGETLMQSFSYSAAPLTKAYILQIDFDPDAINKILRDAGVPIWEQDRPLVLVWLAYQATGHPAEILASDAANLMPAQFKQIAEQRGVPLIFPVMDVAEMSQVSVNDVATPVLPTLMNAAKRYGSDALLIGNVQQTPTGYTTQWKWIMGTEQMNWTIADKDINNVFTTLTAHLADTLASRYASVESNTVQSTLTLKVIGIAQGDDVENLMTYIKHLTPVTDAQLINVENDHVMLSISLRSSPAAFIQALSVGQKLLPDEHTAPAALIYKWNP